MKSQLQAKTHGGKPLSARSSGNRILLGAISRDVFLEPPEEHFAHHSAIYGGTGHGKSKLLEHIMRELLKHERGFCLVDPHGDLAEDLLSFCCRHRKALSPHQLKHLHYLEPSNDEWTFAFDPFHYEDDGGDGHFARHATALQKKAGIHFSETRRDYPHEQGTCARNQPSFIGVTNLVANFLVLSCNQ